MWESKAEEIFHEWARAALETACRDFPYYPEGGYMNIKKWAVLSLASVMAAGLIAGCGSTGKSGSASQPAQEKTLKVGTLAGPHAEFLEEVKKNAEKKGLKLEIVEFNDFISPDEALNSGDIDANMMQHQPFLDNIVKNRGYKLVSVGKTILFPMGVYSDKIHSKDEVKDNMRVAIPNDPSNGGRALEILAKAGLISLKVNEGAKATLDDITDNPRHLQFQEADAAMIPRMLPDLDFGVINNSYATKAGFVPTKDAWIREDLHSPYANVVAVRTEDKDKPEIKLLMECIQTPEMKTFVEEHFKSAAIAAW